MRTMERVRWTVNAFVLSIDQPAGLKVFGLEVLEPVPCLLCESPLICVVVVLLPCLRAKTPDRGGVGREQSLQWAKHKKVEEEVSMRSNRDVIRNHVTTKLYILIGGNTCSPYLCFSQSAQVLLIINAAYNSNTLFLNTHLYLVGWNKYPSFLCKANLNVLR